MAHVLLQNATWLRRAIRTLRINCVDGITANQERLRGNVEASVGVVTALTPRIGYAAAARLAKRALHEGSRSATLCWVRTWWGGRTRRDARSDDAVGRPVRHGAAPRAHTRGHRQGGGGAG
nr:hypothetical protein [Tessaracoccus coleopterorum]